MKTQMITQVVTEDINDMVKKYIDKYLMENENENENETYHAIKDSPLIRSEILDKLKKEYDIGDTNLGRSSVYYLNELIDKCISDIVDRYKFIMNKRKGLSLKLERLRDLKLPEQRSKEWFDMRETMLTASSLADALGKGHFKTREALLIDKTSKSPVAYFSSDIMEWGVKYEPVATTFYEKMNNLSILEFGLVPHPEFSVFGASPDGICDSNSPEEYIGRMLEIKCPPMRKFTGEVPEHYWMQMQGQLETCDLEECDFLQVKLFEYDDETCYQNDKLLINDIVKEGVTEDDLPKGLVLSFITNGPKKKYHYEYSKFNSSYEELKDWSDKIIVDNDITYDEVKYHWWKINHYECTLVGRDRDWWLKTMPEILNFWEDVEHYRKVGNQELIDKKEERKIKRKNKKETSDKIKKVKKPSKNIITINREISSEIESNYLLDSD